MKTAAKVKITNQTRAKLQELADIRDHNLSTVANDVINSYFKRRDNGPDYEYLIGALNTIQHAFESGENILPLINKLKKEWIKK